MFFQPRSLIMAGKPPDCEAARARGGLSSSSAPPIWRGVASRASRQ